ncbi:MAG: ATP-binding protein [Fimbriimonas sp.]
MPFTAVRTVTLLMTDLEGSTAKWERDPQSMRDAMARHDEIATEVMAAHGGALVKPRGEGDSLFVVFPTPLDALNAAAEIQRRFSAEPWPGSMELATRIGVHSGEVHVQEQDFYGPTVNRCARLRGIGHGGQTLVSKATQSLVAAQLPEGMRLRDLGTHRLRDLQEPERVYQLECGGPKAHPPLRSLDARPNNLPLQLTSFVGREEEIQSVQQALRTNRLVSLIGPGGSGKTRLSIQVAAEFNDPFPDGIWFVELALHHDEDEIAWAIAREVAAGADPRGKDPLATLEGIPEALLVLDTAEHAVGEVARVVARALSRVTKLRILVTSREPLRIQGEAVVRVDPLPLPEFGGATADVAMRAPSVQLFVERAAAKLDDFALTDAIAGDIVRICRRLDGIPLALEQAASMVPYLSAKEIADRLAETFDLLESDEEGVVPRHRTLEATIDWSYSLLDPAEQALFRRLSVFPGGFTMSAVEAVCADEALPARNVLKLIRALVDKSLLVRETSADAGEVRHRLLAAVREYGLHRLGRGIEGLEARLLGWACALVRKASEGTYGTGDPSWLQKLEGDHPNLRRAMEVGFTRRDPQVVDLVFGLRHFWLVKGHTAMGLGYLQRAVDEGVNVSALRRAQLLNTLGAFAWRVDKLTLAKNHYEQSLALQRELGDEGGVASVLTNLGIMAGDLGEHERAIRLYDEGIDYAKRSGNALVVRLAHVNRSMSLLDLGRLDESEADMFHAIQMSEEVGDQTRVALLKASLADIEVRRGRWLAAADYLAEAFEIWSEATDVFTMAEALLDVAHVAAAAEIPEAAVRCVRHFLGVARSTESGVKFRAQAKLAELRYLLKSEKLTSPLPPPADLIPSTAVLIEEARSRLRERDVLTSAPATDSIYR